MGATTHNITYRHRGCHLDPNDFEAQLKRIDPELFLVWNNKYLKFQVKKKKYRPRMLKYKDMTVYYNQDIEITIKTLTHEQLNGKTLDVFAFNNWHHNNMSNMEFSAAMEAMNDELDRRKDAALDDELKYQNKQIARKLTTKNF